MQSNAVRGIRSDVDSCAAVAVVACGVRHVACGVACGVLLAYAACKSVACRTEQERDSITRPGQTKHRQWQNRHHSSAAAAAAACESNFHARFRSALSIPHALLLKRALHPLCVRAVKVVPTRWRLIACVEMPADATTCTNTYGRSRLGLPGRQAENTATGGQGRQKGKVGRERM
jgi:hypothetical protein